jgi:hypothetical protein
MKIRNFQIDKPIFRFGIILTVVKFRHIQNI